MFEIKYEIDHVTENQVRILRDGEIMTTFDVITALTMIPKLLRQLAIAQGKLKITPKLDEERNDILAWLMIYHD